jgi:hypothetical protein
MKLIASTLAIAVLAITPAFGANDPGSFGRTVKFLDVSSGPYALYAYRRDTSGCSAGMKCTQISLDTANTVNDTNVATITLPAFSARSLLCFSITPNASVTYRNWSPTTNQANVSFRINTIVQSTVFNNPALIDPFTGLPLNGKIESAMTGFRESFPIAPNQLFTKTWAFSRECIGGMISTSMLQKMYGLSALQAQAVFSNPITVSLSTQTDLQQVDDMTFQLNFRLFGD